MYKNIYLGSQNSIIGITEHFMSVVLQDLFSGGGGCNAIIYQQTLVEL